MILFPIKFSDNAEYNELVNCDQPYASTLDSSAQNRLKIDCLLILTELWLLKDVSVCHHNDTSILKRIVVSSITATAPHNNEESLHPFGIAHSNNFINFFLSGHRCVENYGQNVN